MGFNSIFNIVIGVASLFLLVYLSTKMKIMRVILFIVVLIAAGSFTYSWLRSDKETNFLENTNLYSFYTYTGWFESVGKVVYDTTKNGVKTVGNVIRNNWTKEEVFDGRK